MPDSDILLTFIRAMQTLTSLHPIQTIALIFLTCFTYTIATWCTHLVMGFHQKQIRIPEIINSDFEMRRPYLLAFRDTIIPDGHVGIKMPQAVVLGTFRLSRLCATLSVFEA